MARFFKIPPMWQGRTVAIIGSGPSRTEEEIEHLYKHRHDVRVIACNREYQFVPWANWLHGSDVDFWDIYPDAAECDIPLKTSTTVKAQTKYGVKLLALGEMQRLETKRRHVVAHCRNSGGQAINIAYHAGASRVLLIGFDMRMQDRQAHHHGGHHGKQTTNEHINRHIRNMERIAVQRLDMDIINCTPGSALQGFKKASLVDIL